MNTQTLAAIDLGSNSFHMVVARINNQSLQIVDKIKQRVQLAQGLDEYDRLSEQAICRGLEALALFAQRLIGMDKSHIRIIATYTLRKATNAQDFIERAQSLLGVPIEVVSGKEEARLIYLGVAHTQHNEGQRLVIDIGGGSTELIIGDKFEPSLTSSRTMGCVSFTQCYFPQGKLTENAFEQATLAAEKELESIASLYKKRGWKSCLGASGTVKTVTEVLANQGNTDRQITLKRLKNLKQQLISFEHSEHIQLTGLTNDRKPVFAAGLAILIALFHALEIEKMDFSDGALREGVLYEMHARMRHHDIRERTAASLAKRYQLDLKQAEQVNTTALYLYDQVASEWKIDAPELRDLLSWGATLHEVGLQINYSAIHRHSAYILQHSDLPGFNQVQQKLLASLVRFHRKSLKLSELDTQQPVKLNKLYRLIRILRLAVLLNKKRLAVSLEGITLTATEQSLCILVTDADQLLLSNLNTEKEYCSQVDWQLDVLNA